ncbi:piggyBac transposable element-derived protein 4-like [Venturia canescens]|uniref:piggyBac transposable element-derived protein 4-like n=1 Tax=Venturia canescens TaxID=32260 RepID=UPI001C9D0726|nr:piggyBac transposable element-derived protein 4-like [Venturia canescens]
MVYNLRQNHGPSYADRCEEIENFGDNSSESEEDIQSEESHNSDYEESTNSEIDDDEQENSTNNGCILQSRARGRPTAILRGKNGFKWHTKWGSRHSHRNAAAEVIIPAPQREASHKHKIEEFWKLLFNDEMFKIIVDCTNAKIEEVCLTMISNSQQLQTYHHHTDVTEISAFIELLYYSGQWKSNNVATEHLWNKINGTTFFRCVMSRARFTFIAKCLHFDVKSSREPMDRLAPIRKLWDLFIGNCSRYYKPSKYCTVDEQLLSFRGKCRFRMFIKSKPDRYGMKIITLNDARTSYLIYGIPYLGKIGNGPTKITEDFFREVTKPIHQTRRSVTCDNWFTSIPLLTNMLEPPYSMEITGTIRKNKREVPVEFLVADKKPPSAKFAFTSDLTLLSFSPKKYKVVLLASSHLRTTNITDGKPDIVLHYNITKGGTDTFDQLCHSYTTARGMRRWPLRFFSGC